MTNPIENDSQLARRSRIRAALALYPHVDDETLADMIQWFRKEASPLEIQLIAHDPRLRRPYRELKTRHLDRLKGANLFWIAALLLLASLAVAVWAVM